jgi:hypothetical protein
MPVSKLRKLKKKKGKQLLQTWWTPFRRVYIGFGVLATIVGFVAGAVALLPRVSVESVGLVDPSSTSPTLFEIINTGPITLKSIEPMLGICAIDYVGSAPIRGNCNGDPIQTGLIPTFWRRDKLEPGDRYTIAMQDVLRPDPPSPIANADISISVSYGVPFTWWNERKDFRFFTKKEGDGKLYWFRK